MPHNQSGTHAHCSTSAPRISVIIPVFNAANYLKECINSVINQTFQDFEVIAVNDGSSDESLSILQSIECEKLRVINQRNAGVSVARNAGIDAAKGEYLCFLDADDMFEPDCLQIMYQGIADADLYIASSRSSIDLSTLPKIERSNQPKPFYEIWDRKTIVKKCIEDDPHIYFVWAKLYRTEIVPKIRFPEGYRHHEDSYFVFLFATICHKVIVEDIVVLDYRYSPNSASRAKFNYSKRDMIRLAEQKYAIALQQFPEYADIAGNLPLKAYMAYLDNLISAPIKHFPECISIRKNVCELKHYYIALTPHDELRIKNLTSNFYHHYTKTKVIAQLIRLRDKIRPRK